MSDFVLLQPAPIDSKALQFWAVTDPDLAKYNIECVSCGLLPTVTFKDIGKEIATHYVQLHPDQAAFIRYGEHYTAYPAPDRCDFCNAVAERPHWTHQATPPIPIVGAVDSGSWLICDPCHELITGRDIPGALERWWRVQSRLSPVLVEADTRAGIENHVVLLLRMMILSFDAGTRDLVG